MSKSFYMQCKSLHTLPKFTSTTQRIQVGNSQCVSVLFIIPLIVDIHGHRFKIYTLVSEIHEMVVKYLNRSIPIYPEREIILKPNEQKLVKVKVPFMDEISGLAIIKIIDGSTYSSLLIN